jgi:hypothetical protein
LCLIEHHTTKTYTALEVQIHSFLTLSLNEHKWLVTFKPQPLYPWGMSPQCSLHRRLSGPQRQYGRCGEKKNLLILPGIEPRFIGCPVCSYTDRPIYNSDEKQYSLSIKKCICVVIRAIFNAAPSQF